MQLYIMRHGEAQGFLALDSSEDSQRALSSEGETEVNVMANWFKKMNIKPKHIFVSPYLRAQQTCSLVSQKMNTVISTLDFITPLDEAKPVHDFIDGWVAEYLTTNNQVKSEKAKHLDNESIVIISHMPLVSFLVAELTQPNNAPIFATGAVAHIDYDINKMQGELVQLISPTQL